MSVCPTLAPEGAFLSGMLYYVDCQAQVIGATGYQALAAPGSIASIAMTAALTLFIALFGYRMLFGQIPGVRDTTVALVKIGVVLALASSWPAFRTLVYDVVLQGPAELAAQISGGSALPGAGGGLVAHLQAVDDALVELSTLGAGRPTDPEAVIERGSANGPLIPQRQQQASQRPQQAPRWDPAHDALLLGQARTAYLTVSIAAFASVRLVGGLLLTLGPLFALFLLFDGTRGLFEGWVRALVGAALGALSTAIILGVELALVEPWLAAILVERRADIATPSVPVELLVVTWVFGLTLLAALIACARVAQGFRMPGALFQMSGWVAGTARSGQSQVPILATPAVDGGTPERSRALAIADAAAATERREDGQRRLPAAQLVERGGNVQTPARGPASSPISPIGQSARRRTSGRVSAGRNRRDAV